MSEMITDKEYKKFKMALESLEGLRKGYQKVADQVRELESQMDEVIEKERSRIMVQMQREFDSRVDALVRKRARQLEKKGKRRNGKRVR